MFEEEKQKLRKIREERDNRKSDEEDQRKTSRRIEDEKNKRKATEEATRESDAMSEGEGLSVCSNLDRKIMSAVLRGMDVTEVYSPERVTRACLKMGLWPGSSMDLTNGWDFSKSEDRLRAWRQIKSENPYLLIGSPPCTMFSVLQAANCGKMRDCPVWMARFRKRLTEAEEHVKFCCMLYKEQLKRGRHFLHEHPWSAGSWKMPCIDELMKDSRVSTVRSDLCKFGMESEIPGEIAKRVQCKKQRDL